MCTRQLLATRIITPKLFVCFNSYKFLWINAYFKYKRLTTICFLLLVNFAIIVARNHCWLAKPSSVSQLELLGNKAFPAYNNIFGYILSYYPKDNYKAMEL